MRFLPSRTARAAALAASSALLLSACDFSVNSLPLPGGADLGDDPYAVTVEFRDVLDLVPQSAVKVDDVSVGRVESVDLDGYTAEVTVLLRKDVKLPDNAVAEIRQTSLLGEKFVSLKPPAENPAAGRLSDGDRITLDRSGRNPEVEEVLGALSLVLNGGGVAQLKTITAELNRALEGRESSVRSVLRQLRTLMAQLDDNRDEIVTALERVNSLAVSVNRNSGALEEALDELPSALDSIDGQRADLVRMLKALTELSDVGTRVIRASKEDTIASLRALAPTLTELAKAGDDLPRSLQIVLTFPFVDSVVGKTPAQARDLHMGDFTNLSVELDLDLRRSVGLGLPGGPKVELPGLPDLPLPNIPLPTLGVPGLTTDSEPGGLLPGLGLPGLGRAAVGAPAAELTTEERDAQRGDGVDTGLAALLTWGVTAR